MSVMKYINRAVLKCIKVVNRYWNAKYSPDYRLPWGMLK